MISLIRVIPEGHKGIASKSPAREQLLRLKLKRESEKEHHETVNHMQVSRYNISYRRRRKL